MDVFIFFNAWKAWVMKQKGVKLFGDGIPTSSSSSSSSSSWWLWPHTPMDPMDFMAANSMARNMATPQPKPKIRPYPNPKRRTPKR